jgi:restriction endonuclease Mrr
LANKRIRLSEWSLQNSQGCPATISNGAVQYAQGLSDKVVLIDGETLANLMIDHSAGVALEEAYEIKRVDSDYFNQA